MADGKLQYDISADSRGFEGPLASANGAIGKLGAGLSGLVGPAAGLLGIAGGIGAIGKALGNAASAETTAVAFRVLVGDATRAKNVLAEIKKLSDETPFEFPELASAGRKLLAFGAAAEEIPALLTKVGDIATGIEAPIGEIAELYGKARVQGTLFAEDINQLQGRGIPIIQEFAKQLGVGEMEVKKLASEGRITFPMLEKAFQDLTSAGGDFHGMMAEQSQITTGLVSTLKGGINEIFTILGTPINDAIKPLLQGAIALTKQVGKGLQDSIAIGQAAFANGQLGELVGGALKIAGMEFVNLLTGGLQYAGQVAGRIFQFAFKQVTRMLSGDFNAVFTGMASGLGQILTGIGDLIRSGLGGPFNAIVANFQAGLQFAVEKLLEGLGKVPFLGEKLGLKDFQGTGFAELLEQALGGSDPASLKASGEAAIKAGLGAMGNAIKSRAGMLATDLDAALSGLAPFQNGSVFDTEGLKKTQADLLKSLAPKPGTDAGSEIAKPIVDAAKKAGAAISSAGSAAPTGSESPGSDPAPSGRNKIKLYSAAESEQRRLGRMSQADKDKLAAGGSNLGNLRLSPSGLAPRGTLAGAAAAAASGPSAITPPRPGGASADGKQKTGEQSLIELLTLIEANTKPLSQLAVA